MKKIGFIGAYDKTDLVIYIAKILTVLGQKVLIIDATTTQKSRYVVPVINPTTMYVTEYEDIDIAVGFSNTEDIKRYLGIADDSNLEYDFILVDTDDYKGFGEYNLAEAQKNYFVTSFDVYSLKRGLEALSDLKEPISLTKVLFSKDMLKEEEERKRKAIESRLAAARKDIKKAATVDKKADLYSPLEETSTEEQEKELEEVK